MTFIISSIVFGVLTLITTLIGIYLQKVYVNKTLFANNLTVSYNYQLVRSLIIIAFFTSIYVILNVLSFMLPASRFIYNLYIVIPCLLGFMYGPLAGLFCGCAGNALASAIFSPDGIWYIGMIFGYGAIGFIAGLIGMFANSQPSWTSTIVFINITLVLFAVMVAGILVFESNLLASAGYKKYNFSLLGTSLLFGLPTLFVIICTNVMLYVIYRFFPKFKFLAFANTAMVIGSLFFAILIGPIYFWAVNDIPLIVSIVSGLVFLPLRVIIDAGCFGIILIGLDHVPNTDYFLFKAKPKLLTVVPIPIHAEAI